MPSCTILHRVVSYRVRWLFSIISHSNGQIMWNIDPTTDLKDEQPKRSDKMEGGRGPKSLWSHVEEFGSCWQYWVSRSYFRPFRSINIALKARLLWSLSRNTYASSRSQTAPNTWKDASLLSHDLFPRLMQVCIDRINDMRKTATLL